MAGYGKRGFFGGFKRGVDLLRQGRQAMRSAVTKTAQRKMLWDFMALIGVQLHSEPNAKHRISLAY